MICSQKCFWYSLVSILKIPTGYVKVVNPITSLHIAIVLFFKLEPWMELKTIIETLDPKANLEFHCLTTFDSNVPDKIWRTYFISPPNWHFLSRLGLCNKQKRKVIGFSLFLTLGFSCNRIELNHKVTTTFNESQYLYLTNTIPFMALYFKCFFTIVQLSGGHIFGA